MLNLLAAALLTFAPQSGAPKTAPIPVAQQPRTSPIMAAAHGLPTDTVAALLIPPMLGGGLQDLNQVEEFGAILDHLAALLPLPEQLSTTRLGRALRNGAAFGWLPTQLNKPPSLLLVATLGNALADIVPALATLPSTGGNGMVRFAITGKSKLFLAIRDGNLAIGATEAIVIAALERVRLQTAPSLAEDAQFAASLTGVTSPRLAFMFARTNGILASLSERLPAALLPILTSLRRTATLDRLPWISAAWQVVGSDIVADISLPATDLPLFLAELTTLREPLSPTLAQVIPNTAKGYNFGTFNVKRTVAALEPMLATLLPEATKQWLKDLANIENQTGIDARDALFDGLTGQVATVTGVNGELTVIAALANANSFGKLLQKIVPALGIPMQYSTCAGLQCWRVNPTGKGDTPLFAVIGNWLTIAGNDAQFTSVAEQIQSNKQNPAAAETLRTLSNQKALTLACNGTLPLLEATLNALLGDAPAAITDQKTSLVRSLQTIILSQQVRSSELLKAGLRFTEHLAAEFGNSAALAKATTSNTATDTAAVNSLVKAEQTGPTQESVPAVEGLLTHTDSKIAARAAWLLGEWKVLHAALVLAQAAIQHSSPQVRFQAMSALVRVAGDSVIEQLTTLSSDSDRKIRTLAVQGLSRSNSPRATTAVLSILEKQGKEAPQDTPTDLIAALMFLHDLGDAAILLPAASAITFENAQVGKGLTFLFQELSPKLNADQESNTLLAVLDHPITLLRQYAIQRLGELRKANTITALEGRLTKEGPMLQPLIQVSLAQIRGEAPVASNWLLRTKSNCQAIYQSGMGRWQALPDDRKNLTLATAGGTLTIALILVVLLRRTKKRRSADSVIAMVGPSTGWQDPRSTHSHNDNRDRSRTLVGASAEDDNG
ncbi:MAG: HEAT repeat domain-containing protein [Planctomycetes bacterium]|nr:HEAT repeat domain-containing protein [Planctomycetota bacterium]